MAKMHHLLFLAQRHQSSLQAELPWLPNEEVAFWSAVLVAAYPSNSSDLIVGKVRTWIYHKRRHRHCVRRKRLQTAFAVTYIFPWWRTRNVSTVSWTKSKVSSR